MSSSSQLSCTLLDPTSRSCAFRNLTGRHWLMLCCASARTSNGFRTRYGSTTAPSGRHVPFPLIYSSPDNPIPPEMTLAQFTATTCQQASIDRNQERLSAWCFVTLVPRSQPSHSARGGNARSSCSGSCRQWRLQCEVVSFRRCGGTRMQPFRVRGSIWFRRRSQDLRIMGEPSRPRDTMLWLSCLKKSKIVQITVISGQLVLTQTKRSASAVLKRSTRSRLHLPQQADARAINDTGQVKHKVDHLVSPAP